VRTTIRSLDKEAAVRAILTGAMSAFPDVFIPIVAAGERMVRNGLVERDVTMLTGRRR